MLDEMEKDTTITLRLSKAEHEAWSAAAAGEDRPLSSWIRVHCNAALPVRDLDGEMLKARGAQMAAIAKAAKKGGK